jgi:hypothetical protein
MPISARTSSRTAADRNLLFGILALQIDFISCDALVKAMNAWVPEKTKPLGQILVDQGALRSDAQAVLETLVQKHLELHGNDSERSLAALTFLGSTRKELEQVADPDVHASLAQVSVTRPPEEDSGPTRLPLAGMPTSSQLRGQCCSQLFNLRRRCQGPLLDSRSLPACPAAAAGPRRHVLGLTDSACASLPRRADEKGF